MALEVYSICFTDDHTSRSAAEGMSQLQLDRGSPKGPEACRELLRDLDFQNEHQDEEEYSQFVFQGQCLILGDSRVGKTSLVKSLTGKPFDSEEPSTKGVQTSLVDRKWQALDADTGLMFGSFARFWASVRRISASFDSRGYNNLSDREVTSILSPDYKFWLKYWLISFMWLLSFATPFDPWSFYVFSFAVLVTAFFPNTHNGLIVCPVSFIIGLVTAHILTGYFKGLDCSKDMLCVGTKMHVQLSNTEMPVLLYVNTAMSQLLSKLAWFFHVFVLAHLANGIITNLLRLAVLSYFNRFIFAMLDNLKPSLPGQLKFNNKTHFLLLGIVTLIISSVISGFSLGCAIQLLIPMSISTYCIFLHFPVNICSGLLIFCFIRTLCRGGNIKEGIASPIFFILVIENTPCSLFSFYSMASYAAMFAGCSCYFIIILSNYLVRHSGDIYKYVFVDRVALDYQKLRRALNDKFLSLKLGILDFAGDEEYYAYHHLFLRNQAMYVVAFNMAHFAADNFETIAVKIQRLSFWLESICSQVAPKTPIFLVGTHRGNIQKSILDCLHKYLQESLWQNYSDELVMNEEDRLVYFPVENKQGSNDSGIQNLQRKIIFTAEERKTTLGCKIPFSWIKIQDAIINLRQNKKARFCVTLEQFPTSFNDIICSNWSKKTLKYFHERGVVIYVDPGQDKELSKWVLLKPSTLVDVIIQLVSPPTDDEVMSQHGFRRDWTLLHNTGMLTESLLWNILARSQENEEAMKGFLEEYDIICPLFYKVNDEKEEAKVTHFVPSLLPMSHSENGNTPVWHGDPTDKKFFVFFKRFLPEPLFHHLLSRAHRLSMANFPYGQPVIYRDGGRFWFTPTQPYRLLILKKENMIEVTFSCRDGQGLKPSDVLSLVFSMVQGICQRHFPYVTFHCGPACPSDKCPGHQGDYISHPGVQQSSSRPHVFNVLPARQEDLFSSFYCVNQNFENDLKEWLL